MFITKGVMTGYFEEMLKRLDKRLIACIKLKVTPRSQNI